MMEVLKGKSKRRDGILARAGKMAQLVNCLLCKHKDSDGITSRHIKKLAVRQISEFHWPANLKKSVNFRFSERLLQNK